MYNSRPRTDVLAALRIESGLVYPKFPWEALTSRPGTEGDPSGILSAADFPRVVANRCLLHYECFAAQTDHLPFLLVSVRTANTLKSIQQLRSRVEKPRFGAFGKIRLNLAKIRLVLSRWTVDKRSEEAEVFLLFLFVLLLPVVAVVVLFCILAALFLIPVILLTLPVGIPLWMLTALFSEHEVGRDA